MSSSAIKRRIAGALQVPSLPEIVRKLDVLMSDADVALREIGRCIACDPPLSARLLTVVNSSYYGLRVPVASLEHAVSVLGMDALKNLLLEVTVFERFAHLQARGYDLRRTWKHSVLGARLMVHVSRRLPIQPPVGPDLLYLAGLMHEIGELVLIDAVPDELLAVVEEARLSGRAQHEVEAERLRITHGEVGAQILRRWGMPPLVVQLTRAHHDPAGKVKPSVEASLLAACDALSEVGLGADEMERARTAVDALGLAWEPTLELGLEQASGLGELGA